MRRPAFIPSSWDLSGEAFRRRGVSVALAAVIHLLLLLMLLRLAAPVFVPVAPAPKGTTLDLLPDREPEADSSEKDSEEKKEKKQAPAKPAPKLPKPVVEVPSTQSAPQSDIWSKVIPLTRRELASVDTAISRPSEPEAKTAGGGPSTPVVGTGPKGQPLYAAQWYREPTNAQLSPYIPAGAPRQGFGIVACQTVADYRVDNCQELDQSPPGSGLAGAVRQAAWQFRVIPPRVGGRTLVGTWVQIRIDYTQSRRREAD